MADFSNIIQEINADINTNGSRAITGAKLNQVLLDMIAEVNAEKQDPLTFDKIPTEDSPNPVQSGGVYDALQNKPTIYYITNIQEIPLAIISTLRVGDILRCGSDYDSIAVVCKIDNNDVYLVSTDGNEVETWMYRNGVCYDYLSYALSDFANKFLGATQGDVAVFDSLGNPVDSGKTLGVSVPADAVFTDTKNTAGATDDRNSTLYIVGVKEVGDNKQTYTNGITIRNVPYGTYIVSKDSGGSTKDSLTINGNFYLREACGKNVDTSISSGSTSDNLPTSQAVENRIASAIQAAQVGAAMFQGDVNSGTDISSLTAYSKGWYWVVATAGTYVGQTCEVGDFIFCVADYNSAYSSRDFSVVQNNIDMSVIPRVLKSSGIEQLTNAQCESLRIGDIVVNNNRNCYVVESKDDLYLSLINVNGTIITRVYYTNTILGSNWQYSSTSSLNISNKSDKVTGATNGNLAGLDSNGNLTDSGYAPSGFATAAQGAKADTAYQKPQTGIPESDLSSDVQQALQKHFKGWWPNLATLKAAHTATDGDSAYVKDVSPATTWSIYVYDATATTDNNWADSGTDADTSNVQTFESGEEVNETYIDDTHLVNPKDGALLTAEDVMQLKAKLEGVTASEVKVNAVVGTNVTTGAYVSGETGLLVTPGSSASRYAYFELAIPQGTKSIRFATGTKTSGAKIGYSIGHYAENVYVPTRKFYFDVAETTPPSGIVEKVIEVLEGETTFRTTVATVATYSSITLSNFYCYLQSGDGVLDYIPEIVNGWHGGVKKALSAEAGKELHEELFGVTEISTEVLTPVSYDWSMGNVDSNPSVVTLKKVTLSHVKAKGLVDYRGKRLVITNRPNGAKAYYMILAWASIPSVSSGTEYTLQQLVENGWLSSIHNTGDPSIGFNGWKSLFEVPENGGSVALMIPDDAVSLYTTGELREDLDTNRNIAKLEVVTETKVSDGVLDELSKEVSSGGSLMYELGDINSSGDVVEAAGKAVTGFINNGNGFYMELQDGYHVERAVLYDKNGNLVTYNYYVHDTSGHASTDNNCWGNNEQLPQFFVRLVLKCDTDGNSMPLQGIIKNFVYLNDNRLSKVFPSNLDYAKFIYKLHQLTNIIWSPVEKAQNNYGGDGTNNTLWFLKDSVVTGVPYSTETEYSKFIGIDVAFRTFLSAAKNKRSVIYTECVEQGHARSAYGFSYHGEANYTGNFYGAVCTGLTSYLLGYNVNEYVTDMDTKLGNANKIAHGKETLYWGDNVVTIDDLAQQLQPMDIILNSSHISVISDVYKDEYGVVQYVVWAEQTGPTARMIPYSKDMLAKRFANQEFSIYRLPSETWADALAKDVENTKGIIQNSFFDFEPKDVEIDPDISTFEGEYAVFVDNADNDNTDSYNNYKAFLNIHRGGVYTSLQIFGEDEDVSTATPIEVNISANSGTFIYNSSIYADDSMDKDDWIVVDLMQLSPKLAAGKYKARVVGSDIESGFTHFQIVRISMTPTWNGNYVTRLDFNVEGGNVVAVSQQTHIRPYKIKDLNSSEQEQGYVTFSGDGWDASSFYIKLVVHTDYGTAVKRINKSSYSS